MTTHPKLFWRQVIVVGCIFIFFSLTGLAFAQSEVSTTSPDSAASQAVATTTESATKSDRWFNSDFISGDIQVGDFVIGPGKVELTIKPGQTVTRNISVTNRISDKRTFALAVEDMSGSADPSKAVVLLGDQSGPYSLKNYFSFPNNTFTLALGERAQIPVTITMPPNAEPGGYYVPFWYQPSKILMNKMVCQLIRQSSLVWEHYFL